MSRPSERIVRKWNLKTSQGSDTSSTEEFSSPSESIENSPYVKDASTPLRRKWKLDRINRSPQKDQGQEKSEDTEEESSDEKAFERIQECEELSLDDREKYQDDRKRGILKQKRRHDGREKRRHDKHFEESGNGKRKDTSGLQSSEKHYDRGDTNRSKKKNQDCRGEDELPITEILKRSQENTRVKYEHEPPLPKLTTDKIYVQHRGGFSAMKINRSRGSGEERNAEIERSNDIVENQNSPPIRVAIAVEKLWKSAGLLFQGTLAGMALMHLIMLHAFFKISMEFIVNHSMICEIYMNIFSFLIAVCIVSSFDKFDLARFDMEHLREIYVDYNKAVIAIPLYLIIFCLHQICSKTDNHLALVHYYNLNDSLWENATNNVQILLNDLTSWQKMSMAKDILAAFAWLFVSFGTKDDAFLIHLESMEKYANDVDSSRH